MWSVQEQRSFHLFSQPPLTWALSGGHTLCCLSQSSWGGTQAVVGEFSGDARVRPSWGAGALKCRRGWRLASPGTLVEAGNPHPLFTRHRWSLKAPPTRIGAVLGGLRGRGSLGLAGWSFEWRRSLLWSALVFTARHRHPRLRRPARPRCSSESKGGLRDTSVLQGHCEQRTWGGASQRGGVLRRICS